MSRHEGVSCDACLRSNFRGRRYKCLVCYDYDLCAGCHEAGSVTSRHAADHPMQCILTRTDAELFYGGEAVPPERAQSLVCPHCGQLGLTELSLADHVAARHGDVTTQVVCPVCAAVPSGEPNHVTENLSAHLSTDHRGGGGGRLLSSSDSEPSAAGRSAGRRAPQRGVGAARTRRFNMHFRESMDPITELLSQLSGAGRTAASSSASSTASQLQQLQMHLQLERQQYAQVVRQHSERAPRRQAASAASTPAAPAPAPAPDTARDERPTSGSTAATTVQSASPPPADSQFLLARVRDEERSLDEARQAADRADRCLFAQEIVLSTLTESLQECLAGCESEFAPAVAAGGATGGADSGAVERTEPPAAAPVQDPAPPSSEPRPTAAAAAAAVPAIGRGGGARGIGGGAAVRVPGRVSAAAAQPGVGVRLLAARGPRKAARPAAAVEGRPSPR